MTNQTTTCTCADCVTGKIASVAGPGCSLPSHEYTENAGTACWNCGAKIEYTAALGLAIEKANAQMIARGAEGWSIADDHLYREELSRLTGEPMIYKPWDADEFCAEGHTFFDGNCQRCGTHR
jgi:hypothetical protein